MATCPAGHDSATDDYCDTCGLVIEAPTAALPVAAAAALPVAAAAAPAAAGADTCAACGAPRQGRFCEECGHDAALPPPPLATDSGAASPGSDSPGSRPTSGSGRGRRSAEEFSGPLPRSRLTAGWVAVVRADRAWFDEVRRREGPDAASVEFPRYCPERRFVLSGKQVGIGRRSRSRGTDPEIDLSGPPLDPGVSAQHAILLARSDGGWEVVDLDSTNGTTIGEGTDPIDAYAPIPLADGDRIRIGAWTTITVQRDRP